MSSILNEWLSRGQTVIPNVLLENYQQLGISNLQFLLLLQLLAHDQKSQAFPNIGQISSHLNVSEERLYDELNELVNKKIIAVDTVEEDGKMTDRLSFDLLWDKLENWWLRIQKSESQKKRSISENSLYQVFEEEFGRPLSPIELETIGKWLDEDRYSPDLIYMALRESILNQVYNLNYIDRILLSWEKQNITTKDQVEQKTREFRRKKYEDQESYKSDKQHTGHSSVPLINWLDRSSED